MGDYSCIQVCLDLDFRAYGLPKKNKNRGKERRQEGKPENEERFAGGMERALTSCPRGVISSILNGT